MAPANAISSRSAPRVPRVPMPKQRQQQQQQQRRPSDDYVSFIASKRVTAQAVGFEVDAEWQASAATLWDMPDAATDAIQAEEEEAVTA